MTEYTIFGNHAANSGDIEPFTAKEVEIVENKTYNALKNSPTPRCMPIPPFRLFADKNTPKNVKINAATEDANRL